MSHAVSTHLLKLLGIALAYLLALCTLDLYFVFGVNQVIGWYNNLVWLMFTLPFAFSFYTYKFIKKSIILIVVAFVVGVVLSYLEFMWVAIEFHTIIGGDI